MFTLTVCPYCYGRGYYFYYSKGVQCCYKECPHCQGQQGDAHDLVTKCEPEPKKEEAKYGAEEDF